MVFVCIDCARTPSVGKTSNFIFGGTHQIDARNASAGRQAANLVEQLGGNFPIDIDVGQLKVVKLLLTTEKQRYSISNTLMGRGLSSTGRRPFAPSNKIERLLRVVDKFLVVGDLQGISNLVGLSASDLK